MKFLASRGQGEASSCWPREVATAGKMLGDRMVLIAGGRIGFWYIFYSGFFPFGFLSVFVFVAAMVREGGGTTTGRTGATATTATWTAVLPGEAEGMGCEALWVGLWCWFVRGLVCGVRPAGSYPRGDLSVRPEPGVGGEDL